MEEKKKEVMPFVMLDLDKPRKFRFDLNSLVEIKLKYGVGLNEMTTFLKECLSDPEKVRFLFWIGLKWEDKELTEEQVGRMLSYDKILELSGTIVSQVEGSIVDEEGKKD
ncbi:unnamed protein product, partial [marine sediment metagenome]